MIWITGDLHGGETAWHISSSRFKEGNRGDIVISLGDLGGVWYHDYHTNEKHHRREDFFLESQLRQRFLWLAVDGNHENFARLFGGEFPLVDIFGGKAYRIRDHVYYLKRGEVYTIEGATLLAFGGAMSHDKEPGWIYPPNSMGAWGSGKEWNPGRTEGIDWWPEEIPSREDFENACRNLDRIGWKVDYVISHTCPQSRLAHFLHGSLPSDPTGIILQEIYERLEFGSWHFGHFHFEKRVDNFVCHYNQVQPFGYVICST
ncbi:hypothetical protein F6V25_03130 [Oryzomonas japonica]|uniref:Calcineurin-like phosphoesterase domain-containing protein n=1 Tax=Oryzomonas japonica TaxID=2603858 RepID=A0A7J4ZVT3_9BACT|nr:hypothetical protein [Oryzomonas japonica]KAB0667704.1 hypothetical protein F6V25_03130 [Oryzomonas japonica]